MRTSVFRASDVSIKRRRARHRILIAILIFSAGFTLLSLAYDPLRDILPYAATLMLLEAVLFCFSPLLFPEGWIGGGREERVVLAADREGVSVDEKRVLARAAIATAVIERNSDGSARVILLTHAPSRNFEAVLADPERARAFLAALGLETDRSAAYFRVLRAPLATTAGKVGAGIVTMVATLALLAAVAVAMQHFHSDHLLLLYLPLLMLMLLVRTRFRLMASVVVGADRVVVRVGRNARAIPYPAIRSIVRRGSSVELLLSDGDRLCFTFSPTSDPTRQPVAMAQRIEHAMRTHAAYEAGTDCAPQLLRAGRSVSEWTRSLRALLTTGEGGYRTPALEPETFWRVVEAPGADPAARAAAAVALVSVLDEEGRTRLRVAAEATALPGVRAVLEAAAGADGEGAVEQALERCEKS